MGETCSTFGQNRNPYGDFGGKKRRRENIGRYRLIGVEERLVLK